MPVFSHETHGKRFFRFPLEVERLSGTVDTLDVIAEASAVEALDWSVGDLLEVEGQIRTYNNHSGQGRKLVITVLAQRLSESQDIPDNQVFLQGILCRDPVYRRTPLGREICDVMLAVERPYGRRDYIPCILWGSLARMAGECRKGDCLWITGRLQSRVYVKETETGPENRIAYEVSAITAGTLD